MSRRGVEVEVGSTVVLMLSSIRSSEGGGVELFEIGFHRVCNSSAENRSCMALLDLRSKSIGRVLIMTGCQRGRF